MPWVQRKESTTKAEVLFKDLGEQTGPLGPLPVPVKALTLGGPASTFPALLRTGPFNPPFAFAKLFTYDSGWAISPRCPTSTVIMEKTSHLLLHRSAVLQLSSTPSHKGEGNMPSSQPNHKIVFLWFLQEGGSEKTMEENVLNGSGPCPLPPKISA